MPSHNLKRGKTADTKHVYALILQFSKKNIYLNGSALNLSKNYIYRGWGKKKKTSINIKYMTSVVFWNIRKGIVSLSMQAHQKCIRRQTLSVTQMNFPHLLRDE